MPLNRSISKNFITSINQHLAHLRHPHLQHMHTICLTSEEGEILAGNKIQTDKAPEDIDQAAGGEPKAMGATGGKLKAMSVTGNKAKTMSATGGKAKAMGATGGKPKAMSGGEVKAMGDTGDKDLDTGDEGMSDSLNDLPEGRIQVTIIQPYWEKGSLRDYMHKVRGQVNQQLP